MCQIGKQIFQPIDRNGSRSEYNESLVLADEAELLQLEQVFFQKQNQSATANDSSSPHLQPKSAASITDTPSSAQHSQKRYMCVFSLLLTFSSHAFHGRDFVHHTV
jgi:hypothetical protein